MPHHVESGSGATPDTTIDLEYTASGQRVRQVDESGFGSTVTTYIGDLFEQRVLPFSPASSRYKVLVGSRQVAEVTRFSGQETVHYLHDDHLGSTTLITRQDGNVAEARNYDPFGAMTSSGTATGVLASYTGHNDDGGIGLVNMRGRLYDPKIGRFTTADPFTTNPGSSQGWNRYAYVENNPLAFTDPTGFYCVGDQYGGTPYWECTEDPSADARAQAQYEAEQARAGQQSGQASADDAARAAQTQSDAQRAFEDAQRGFGQGEAAMQTGQPPPGYGQPSLAQTPPGQPNPPSAGWTAARIVTGFVPFVGHLTTINDPSATDDEKGWALVGMLFDAATLGTGAGVVGIVKVTKKGIGLVDDAAKPLLGRNPLEGARRTNTDLPGGRATAKSIFRQESAGQSVTQQPMMNGGIRRTAEDGTQIRMNPDGSTRVDLPGRGPLGNETIHFDP